MMKTSTVVSVFLVAATVALGACSTDPCAGRECESNLTVAHEVSFAVAEEGGVSLGFDLDARVSPDNDAKTCGHADMIDPSGNAGIDNNASVLFEAVTMLTSASVQEIIRDAINEGRFLIMMRLIGIDDRENDDCVRVEIFQGQGTPYVGTDDFLLPGQTFAANDELPRIEIECGRVKDGVLTAGPFDGELYISIFAVEVTLTLHRARLRAELTGSGLEHVILGAGVETEALHEVVEETGDPDIQGTGHFLLDRLADMGADDKGRCQQISATILLDATPAFLF